jgi:hypothetical protein
LSFASEASAQAAKEVHSLQVSHALRTAKKYLRLERLNDPIIHRYSIYEYLRLQGVPKALVDPTIQKVEPYVTQ